MKKENFIIYVFFGLFVALMIFGVVAIVRHGGALKDVVFDEKDSTLDNLKTGAEFESAYEAENEVPADVEEITIDWLIGHCYNDKRPKEVAVEEFESYEDVEGEIREEIYYDMYWTDYELALLRYISNYYKTEEIGFVGVNSSARYSTITIRVLGTDEAHRFTGALRMPDSKAFTILHSES